MIEHAESMGLSVVSRDLPRDICGLYDDRHGLILLADWLNQRQRRCTLRHELIHVRHHDPGCGSYRVLYPFRFLIKNDPSHPHTASAGVLSLEERALLRHRENPVHKSLLRIGAVRYLIQMKLRQPMTGVVTGLGTQNRKSTA